MIVILLDFNQLRIHVLNHLKLRYDFDVIDPIYFFKNSLNEMSIFGVMEPVEPKIFQKSEERVEKGSYDSNIGNTHN